MNNLPVQFAPQLHAHVSPFPRFFAPCSCHFAPVFVQLFAPLLGRLFYDAPMSDENDVFMGRIRLRKR
jgi:hypothetical protein